MGTRFVLENLFCLSSFMPVVGETLALFSSNHCSVDLRMLCDFQSEMHLMKGIVPQKHERTVFDTIIQQALDAVVTEGEVGVSLTDVMLKGDPEQRSIRGPINDTQRRPRTKKHQGSYK